MLFNSLHFLIFFIVLTSTYFIIPHKFRWFLLLAASCYFYMVFVPVYILILFFTIIIDYYAGILLEDNHGRKRYIYLIASLIANIGVLAIFKYYNFINLNFTYLLSEFNYSNPIPFLSILLPIGLSFHTFQAMSYTIEVYRGNQKAERNFGIYALYVMFYPQLVAGPIERPQNLIHQFYEKHTFDYHRVTDGLKLMIWGLFKKVVIADRLAAVVDNVYNNLPEHQGLSLIIATIFFSFQIFCDFSGYSDMAIGAAQVMGFKLMTNFNRPYFSKSISEFWKRWHISLSTWFRDYLYISLGGNRVSIPRWYFNLFIVFLVSGLWHGANWTFVIWGALHGFYLVFAVILDKYKLKRQQAKGVYNFSKVLNFGKGSEVIGKRLYKFIQILTTFVLVTFAWIFFRASSLSDAKYVIKYSILGLYQNIHDVINSIPLKINLGISNKELIIGICAVIFMELIHYFQRRNRIREWLATQPIYLRWAVYFIVFFSIYFFGVYENRQFIYFQF